MAIFELYSQRRARELGQENDVYQYDVIPRSLRNQACHIIEEVLGDFRDRERDKVYEPMAQAIWRELGLPRLKSDVYFGEEIARTIVSADDTIALDVMDAMFQFVYRYSLDPRGARLLLADPTAVLKEINYRFKQNGLGYTYENGRLTRIDSQFLHQEAVKPALTLLSEPAFASANQEFREAHEHWRNGKHGPVLVDCLKAFESTMKIIAHERSWALPAKLSASSLVDMCLANDLIPPWYKAHMTGLRGVLEGGIPTPRNKVGGHGAGPGPAEDVPEELVRYVLHMTAATILFLVDAHKARP